MMLVGCQSHDLRLKKADAIIESDPAAALAQLTEVRADKLTDADRAYYALLYTQAQIKTGINVSSDSLIRIARDYYLNDEGGNLKMRAFFYSGMVSYFKDNMTAAMADVIVAYDIAKEMKDPYWIARTAEHIGDIFSKNYNFAQAQQYTAEAADNYRLSGRTESHRYALCDLALVYVNTNQTDRAVAMLDSLDRLLSVENQSDLQLHEYLTEILAFALSTSGQFEALERIRPELEQIEPVSEENATDIMISLCDIPSGVTGYSVDSILAVARQNVEDDKTLIKVIYKQYCLARDSQHYQQAALLADTLLMMHEAIAFRTLNESMIGQQRDFYIMKNKHQADEGRHFRTVMLLVLGVVVITFVAVFIVQRYFLIKRRAELEANLATLLVTEDELQQSEKENKVLLDTIDKHTKQISDLEREIDNNLEKSKNLTPEAVEQLFREQWKTLNILCREYFDGWETESSRRSILVNIEKELDKLRTQGHIKEIEEAVNKYMGNVMKILREECPFFKEKDYVFISLVFAGLSARSIGLFLNMKYKAVYLSKDRFKKRIEESDAPHKELLLSKFQRV